MGKYQIKRLNLQIRELVEDRDRKKEREERTERRRIWLERKPTWLP